MTGWKQRVEDCLDSLVCLNPEVQERVHRIIRFLQTDLPFRVLASVILAQANGIVALCGALSERPVECLTDVVEEHHQLVT